MSARGWTVPTWPKEYGGRGGDAIQQVIWGQEEGQFDAPTGPFTIGLGMCIPTVIAFGSDEHKKRYVQKALLGEEIWCQLFSEPSAGSDVAGLKTRAVKDGDEWVINGEKYYISGAGDPRCKIMITMVKTSPDAPPHRQQSQILVPRDAPGVKILEDGWTAVTQDGKRSAHFEHTVAITDNGPEILTQV